MSDNAASGVNARGAETQAGKGSSRENRLHLGLFEGGGEGVKGQ
jgi:hypothetical protein